MITPGLAAELKLLTQALDLPGTDIAETVMRLAADAHAAVASYVGLSVAITTKHAAFELTFLDELTEPGDIQTSLLVPLAFAAEAENSERASVALVLYAANPGGFIDLAADLTWSTGQPVEEFALDEHLTLPSNDADLSPLTALSTINQALGVLIGRGSIPEQAERDLDARAASAGIEPMAVATLILASLTSPEPDPV